MTLAQEIPFLLLLPEQRKNNMSRRCFRSYNRNDNRPGRGESASILEMIDFVTETQGIDAVADERQTVDSAVAREVYRDAAGIVWVETWSDKGSAGVTLSPTRSE